MDVVSSKHLISPISRTWSAGYLLTNINNVHVNNDITSPTEYAIHTDKLKGRHIDNPLLSSLDLILYLYLHATSRNSTSLSGFICYFAKISFCQHVIPNVASKHSPLVLVFIFSVDDVTTLATNDTCLKLFSRGKTTRLADMAKRPKDPTNNQKKRV